jgi:hypothetical protein
VKKEWNPTMLNPALACRSRGIFREQHSLHPVLFGFRVKQTESSDPL